MNGDEQTGKGRLKGGVQAMLGRRKGRRADHQLSATRKWNHRLARTCLSKNAAMHAEGGDMQLDIANDQATEEGKNIKKLSRELGEDSVHS